MWPVERIISGGQTGADRAALDWAIQRGIPHGGWCPRNRRAEAANGGDSRIDDCYQLNETPSTDYAQRTEWNVRDSDGTVIISMSPQLVKGSLLTAQFAEQYHKPYLRIYLGCCNAEYGATLRMFVEAYDIRTLNVAGPRASEEAAVGQFVAEVLDSA